MAARLSRSNCQRLEAGRARVDLKGSEPNLGATDCFFFEIQEREKGSTSFCMRVQGSTQGNSQLYDEQEVAGKGTGKTRRRKKKKKQRRLVKVTMQGGLCSSIEWILWGRGGKKEGASRNRNRTCFAQGAETRTGSGTVRRKSVDEKRERQTSRARLASIVFVDLIRSLSAPHCTHRTYTQHTPHSLQLFLRSHPSAPRCALYTANSREESWPLIIAFGCESAVYFWRCFESRLRTSTFINSFPTQTVLQDAMGQLAIASHAVHAPAITVMEIIADTSKEARDEGWISLRLGRTLFNWIPTMRFHFQKLWRDSFHLCPRPWMSEDRPKSGEEEEQLLSQLPCLKCHGFRQNMQPPPWKKAVQSR